MPRRKWLLILLAVAVAALGGLVVMAALRDTEPPKLYVEHVERMAEGRPIALFVSADEPATFVLEYAGETYEEVAQEVTFTAPAVAGSHTAVVKATDAAGNATQETLQIIGVAAFQPLLQADAVVTAGDPIGVRLTLRGTAARTPTTPAVADVSVTLDGRSVPLVPGEFVDELGNMRFVAVAATTMTVDPTTQTIRASVVDEFGRRAELEHEVVLTPLPVEVEQLRLSAATLSVVTPEGREREAAAVDDAWSRAGAERLWSEPFLMPISGVHTSGFGDARRYAQGGPVSFHYGLDLAAPTGTPIHATNDGRVIIADHYPIKGGWVAIDHGAGVMSYYFHMSKINVQDGQLVSRGEVIGEVGSEGLSTGPHLHWEMRVHGEASNPLAWVDRLFPGDPR